jgi:type II secretory pathway pseudopilin PulG
MRSLNFNLLMTKMRAQHGSFTSSRLPHSSRQRGEQGFTLVALLAVMTIIALLLVSAAPSVRQQTQRALEEEAIWRGEQVAEAIRLFAQAHGGQLPTSIEQLLEGNPRGSKNVQILRPEAARDPLSSTGEWRLIPPNDPTLIRFQVAVTTYAGGRTPQTRDPLIRRYQVQVGNILNTGTTDEAPGGIDVSANTSGPFIGVASRSRRNSIITYYGIERHDAWVFTPLFR